MDKSIVVWHSFVPRWKLQDGHAEERERERERERKKRAFVESGGWWKLPDEVQTKEERTCRIPTGKTTCSISLVVVFFTIVHSLLSTSHPWIGWSSPRLLSASLSLLTWDDALSLTWLLEWILSSTRFGRIDWTVWTKVSVHIACHEDFFSFSGGGERERERENATKCIDEGERESDETRSSFLSSILSPHNLIHWKVLPLEEQVRVGLSFSFNLSSIIWRGGRWWFESFWLPADVVPLFQCLSSILVFLHRYTEDSIHLLLHLPSLLIRVIIIIIAKIESKSSPIIDWNPWLTLNLEKEGDLEECGKKGKIALMTPRKTYTLGPYIDRIWTQICQSRPLY